MARDVIFRRAAVATIVLVAAANTYELAASAHYTVAVLFGAVVPIIAVVDYWRHRDDPAANQDRMLISFLVALLGYGTLLANFP